VKAIDPQNSSTVRDINNKTSLQQARQLKTACREFEAIFVQQMLKGMRSTIPESGLLEEDASRDMYVDLLDSQVARGIAGQHGGMGIATSLYRQLQQLRTVGK